MPYTLTDWQQEFMLERCSIFRFAEAFGANGKPSGGSWVPLETEVPVHLNQRPSQFEVQDAGVREEGDNVFTLDKLNFPLGVDLQSGDIVKLTTAADAAVAGGFWVMRGDPQVRSGRAQKLVFIASRVDSPPDGVS